MLFRMIWCMAITAAMLMCSTAMAEKQESKKAKTEKKEGKGKDTGKKGDKKGSKTKSEKSDKPKSEKSGKTEKASAKMEEPQKKINISGAVDFTLDGAAFSLDEFANPPSLLWPGVFWMWNGPLEKAVIKEQLEDMASHGVRSVCMIPMPHAFRPDTTNNSMDPDYLTPEFFKRAAYAIDEAAKLKMNWWLYDEGGWPSGEACGKTVEGHPEAAARRVVREKVEGTSEYKVPEDAMCLVTDGDVKAVFKPGETWIRGHNETAWVYRITQEKRVNRLSPEATKRFIDLTHNGYYKVAKKHFGSTILATFTDEPGVPPLDPGKALAWTDGFEKAFEARYQRSIMSDLPYLFEDKKADATFEAALARVRWYDLVSDTFRANYFTPILDWCRKADIASGGHLNGEDETINAARYGYGNALRQLRTMDIPGVDLIWRQIWPEKANPHFFAKYASTAAHQNGTRYAFTESFCVYGNGLTLQQMKWLTDYQYALGLNLMVMGCYPLSTEDHHMTGERPHFGKVNPLWDHSQSYHRHTARLGYAMSCGRPMINTALYYPVRDIWASGAVVTTATASHDEIAQGLLARQCDFDLIDDDILGSLASRCEEGNLVAGAMRYNTVIVGVTRWMRPESFNRLAEFTGKGGRLICIKDEIATDGEMAPEIPGATYARSVKEAIALARPSVMLAPADQGIRVCGRLMETGRLVMMFNQGVKPYEGAFETAGKYAYTLDTVTGEVREARRTEDRKGVQVSLQAGQTILYWLDGPSFLANSAFASVGDSMEIQDLFAAKPVRQFVVGEHNFETKTPEAAEAKPFSESAQWEKWLTADYSGEVEYAAEVKIPDAWNGLRLELTAAEVQYAATVLVDGTEVGQMSWSPWRVELPPLTPGKHQISIRVANTLANELTSERVAKAFGEKSGPGWPSPYHKRAIEFERESRGGGIVGPIALRAMKPVIPNYPKEPK